MKKYYAALAVLGGFAATASAQSQVTVYGIIDVGIARVTGGQSSLATVDTVAGEWALKQATASRLGFRGTEDLGGGLRANFVLEHRFRPDTGALDSPSTFWQGASWVGLSKESLGELRVGRDLTPAFFTAFAGDPWSYDHNVAGFAGYTRAGNIAGSTPVRAANQISYRTPSFGGLTAQVAVAAREGAANTGRNLGFNVTYNAKPPFGSGALYVSLGVNDINGPTDDRVAILTTAYDFGFIRPSLLLARADNRVPVNGVPGITSVEADSWILGATAPLGLGKLKVGFGELDNPAAAGAAAARTRKFGLGYEYYLSKRTSVHADAGIAKGDNLSRTSGIETGIKHVF